MALSASQNKSDLRARRHRRIRAKVKGTAARPRLAVFRSNRALYAQLIDDDACVTLASADSRKLGKKTMVEQAAAVGTAIAKAGKTKGVEAAVFDRAGFTYTGRIKALAEAARSGGLKF